MGSGSGVQAETLKIKPENLTLVDINPEAVKHLKKEFPNSGVFKSNLFQNVKGKFDVIIFNPPYLPEDSREPAGSRVATTGGKKGSEVINRFLKQAHSHLNPNAKIFLLTSSLTKGISWKGYTKKLLSKKKVFYEELYVWKLKLRKK